MGETRRRYPPEFRWQMVELVRAGRMPEELGRERERTARAICNWVRQAERDEGRRADGPTTADQGCQCTSIAFGLRCGEAGVRPSVGSVGDT